MSFLSISLYAQIPTNYCNGTTADWTNFTTTYPIHAYAPDVSNSDVGMDDQFTQGSKDGSLISQWRWVNGNANDKGDITNAGAALTGTNNCYLRFFGDRAAVNGDASIGFWFFVNPVTKNLDGSGTFNGTHTNGDLLILSDFTNGGGSSNISVYVWQNGSLVPADLTGVEWCAGVNTSPQDVVAPLNYTPKGGGTQYPTGSFYEGAINLCQLREQNPSISACFSYFLLETRNSQSITASLQDFAASGFNLTPAAPTLSAIQPTCTVGTGTVTVTAPLGSDLMYSLDGGTYQSSATFNNVSVGTHTVTVQGPTGCTSAGTPITINAQPATPIVPTLSAVQPTCTVATGTITVTSPTTGLQFSLDGGAYAAYPSGGWTVASGTHTVTAKNADGCISGQASIVINAQPPTPAAPTLDAVQPTCTVGTGTITITSSTTGLLFSLDGGTYAAYPAGGYTGVAPGAHTITAKNSDGCISAPANITINAQPSTPAAPTLSTVQPTCTVATGSITVTAPTGTGLTYSLDGGTFQSGTTFNNVAVGVHSVRVQNADGCISAPTSATILSQPQTPLPPAISVIQPTCDVLSGTISVTNPLAGYTYTLNTGASNSTGVFAGLAPGNYTITATNSNGGCTSAATLPITVNPLPQCGQTLCTYTQGAYGNPGGKYCTPEGQKTTADLINYSLGNWPNDQIFIGSTGHSFTIRQQASDIQAIIDLLPGGGNSVPLPSGDYYASSTLPSSLLRNDRLNNTLLAQTITLGLNMGVTTALGSLQLTSGMLLVTAEPANGCNTASTDIQPCSYQASTLTSSSVIQFLTDYTWNGTSFVLDQSSNKTATIAELFNLASAALGGSAYGQSLTAIAALEDQINNIFDECRVFIGYMTSQQYATLTSGCTTTLAVTTARSSELKLLASPNPYYSSIQFNFITPESGIARLEIFDLMGRKLAIVFQGQIEKGIQKTVDYRVPQDQRVPMIYRLTIGNKTSFGKLLPGSTD